MIVSVYRSFILILLTVFAGRVGRSVSTSLYDLLDFQVTAYRYLLQTQETFISTKKQVSGTIDTVKNWWDELIQAEANGSEKIVPLSSESMQTKLDRFVGKLRLISGVSGSIVGVILWKILFDMVF